MSELNEINWAAFQFDGDNELWTEVQRTLEEFEEAEVHSCTAPELDANQRAETTFGAVVAPVRPSPLAPPGHSSSVETESAALALRVV